MWKLAARARQSLLGGCLTLLSTKPSLAQTTAAPAEPVALRVSVHETEAAQACPDESWFEARVASHASRTGVAGNYNIDLSRDEHGWHATITRSTAGTPEPARTLDDRGTSCGPLAEAAALTVAMLADSTASQAQPSPPPAARPQPARPVAPPTKEPSRPPRVFAGVGGGGALGLIAPFAPLFGVGLGLDTRYVSPGFRLMMTSQHRFALDPGSVTAQAWLATAYVCLHPSRTELSVAACATADAGVLHGAAEGFEQVVPSSRPHEAFGAEARGSWYLADSYRLSLSLGATIPVTRESFSVAGLGVAYVPPEVNWRALLFCEVGVF